jgi:ComF family protein
MDVLKSAYRVFVTPFLDFVFPPVCVCCNELLSDSSQRVCEKCWDSIQRVTRDHPLYLETRSKLTESGVVDELVSHFVFEKEGAFQHVAHALKYGGYESVGLELGRRVGRTMNDWGITADGLIPIPLHKAKERERGYNQSDLIARGISTSTGIPVRTDLVHRRKYTQTQTQLSLEQRRVNMEDAFEIHRSSRPDVEGKTFILVDDVITTGATINSCARELKSAGASTVIAASAALAQ